MARPSQPAVRKPKDHFATRSSSTLLFLETTCPPLVIAAVGVSFHAIGRRVQ